MHADLDDIADEPTCQVNHVSDQVTPVPERVLAVESPLMTILTQ